MNFQDYKKLREEPLKSAIYEDFFPRYKYTQIGNIDFVIAKHNVENGMNLLFEDFKTFDLKSILWAEAKQGTTHDIYESFVQLILTIGKERTFEKYIPPKYLGAFDAEKIAFIEYHKIQYIFYQNDFNWNVTPSNHTSKEFKQLYELCGNLLNDNVRFEYEAQEKELKQFIRLNFKENNEISEKISVTKNNFTFVFQQWSKKVMPTIAVDWDKSKKAGIIGADFFLADLLSENGETLKDSLYVVLKKTKYELARKLDEFGFEDSKKVGFTDKQKAYKEFWNIYDRPPKEEYWNYIITRRDLLVPQDIRERKGSFFTPQIWVQKSQEYLADVLGENWQDEYYIWDCCAGTGNLLNYLANYHNVWASTIDKADVDVMIDRTKTKGDEKWNMYEDHIFQFDFLNDDFSKCPEELQKILKDEEKRKRLVIYINPPYAEAANARTISGTGENRTNVAVTQKTYEKYLSKIGIAGRELFAQFFIRIYCEINGCILAEFSKLKMIQAPNFDEFRTVFRAKLEKLFVVPARTFDNVKGNFPIGFFIWDTGSDRQPKMQDSSEDDASRVDSKNFSIEADAFDEHGNFIQKKTFSTISDFRSINDWIITTRNREGEKNIGFMSAKGSDFQNNGYNYIVNEKSQLPHPRGTQVTTKNILEISIYLSVRQCIPQTWLNDRDQFLFPNDGWKTDSEFQADCLVFTLFHGQNRISCEQGTNHWIPFTEEQVGSTKSFKSRFMSDFIAGKIKTESSGELEFDEKLAERKPKKMEFSAEAKAVYDSGLELWKYYHSQRNANPNASFYDIRKYFQGEKNGRMNSDSNDERYTELVSDLRAKMKKLAAKIEPKVYEYGFLK